MPTRTNSQAVQLLLGDEYDGKTSLSPSIDTANAMVDWVVSTDASDPSRRYYTTNVKLPERIEALLACHYYQLADPGYQSRTTSGASGQFNYKTELGFKGSRFGIEAMNCDISGILQQKQKEMEEGGRRRIQVFVPTTCANFATPSGCCGEE